jgi:hypothetical protein
VRSSPLLKVQRRLPQPCSAPRQTDAGAKLRVVRRGRLGPPKPLVRPFENALALRYAQEHSLPQRCFPEPGQPPAAPGSVFEWPSDLRGLPKQSVDFAFGNQGAIAETGKANFPFGGEGVDMAAADAESGGGVVDAARAGFVAGRDVASLLSGNFRIGVHVFVLSPARFDAVEDEQIIDSITEKSRFYLPISVIFSLEGRTRRCLTQSLEESLRAFSFPDRIRLFL